LHIFVIGGTGLVGSYLLPELAKKGNTVYALTRSEGKVEKIKELGVHAIVGDIRNPQTFKDSLPDTLDCIILIAMPSVKPGHRINKKRKEELRKETTDFFRNSMDLAIEYNIPLVLPGGTGFKTKDDEIADETWPIRRVGLTEIGKDTDGMVSEAIRTNNPQIIQLLYGKIYGNGGLFRFMYEMMRKGRSRIIGDGENHIPNIHASDAAAAIIKVVEKMPVGEKFIIADDAPVTQKDFTTYMAELMGKDKPGKVPSFIIRIVLGKDLYEVVSMNCKVSNQKAKDILGWQPKYPSYKEGLRDTIKEMDERPPYFS